MAEEILSPTACEYITAETVFTNVFNRKLIWTGSGFLGKFQEDEDLKDYVRASFRIPGLRKAWGLFVKRNVNPSNGTIQLKLTPRSFHLIVTVDGKTYEYKEENIFKDISDNSEKTYTKVHKFEPKLQVICKNNYRKQTLAYR